MTKNEIKQGLKMMLNEVRRVDGVNVAYCGWKSKQWMIIENEETFEDVRKDDFVPIASFNTREELIDSIVKTQ